MGQPSATNARLGDEISLNQITIIKVTGSSPLRLLLHELAIPSLHIIRNNRYRNVFLDVLQGSPFPIRYLGGDWINILNNRLDRLFNISTLATFLNLLAHHSHVHCVLVNVAAVSLAEVWLRDVVSALVANRALHSVGIVGHHLRQLAVTVLHQPVIALRLCAALNLLAYVALLLISLLNHAEGFVFIHPKLGQRLNHRVAMRPLNDQRVLYLGVDGKHIAALLAGEDVARLPVAQELLTRVSLVIAAQHRGNRLIVGRAAVAACVGRARRQVRPRAKCALFARFEAADGLNTLPALSRSRAVVQAHRRFARLKELGKVGFAF